MDNTYPKKHKAACHNFGWLPNNNPLVTIRKQAAFASEHILADITFHKYLFIIVIFNPMDNRWWKPKAAPLPTEM